MRYIISLDIFVPTSGSLVCNCEPIDRHGQCRKQAEVPRRHPAASKAPRPPWLSSSSQHLLTASPDSDNTHVPRKWGAPGVHGITSNLEMGKLPSKWNISNSLEVAKKVGANKVRRWNWIIGKHRGAVFLIITVIFKNGHYLVPHLCEPNKRGQSACMSL